MLGETERVRDQRLQYKLNMNTSFVEDALRIANGGREHHARVVHPGCAYPGGSLAVA